MIQWLYSERHKQVVVPPIFWHLSFWGSVVSLVYACHVDRLPIILGYAFLPFLYARKLASAEKGGSGKVQVRQEAKALEAKDERGVSRLVWALEAYCRQIAKGMRSGIIEELGPIRSRARGFTGRHPSLGLTLVLGCLSAFGPALD